MARSSGTFKKGQCGNPKGRPKEAAEIKALALAQAPAAIKRLTEIMMTGDDRSASAAAIALLDRGIGKPGQHVEITGDKEAPIALEFIDRPPRETREEWMARKRKEMDALVATTRTAK